MLKIKNLSIRYNCTEKSVSALNQVSFNLASNESLGIIGESGSGKTSLGMAIMGLLEQAEIEGHIDFDDYCLTGMNVKNWRKVRWQRIAMVFQNALEVFNPVITVGEQVAEPLITHLGFTHKAAQARVVDLFEMIGLDTKLDKAYAHELSGGMRQRVLIAMAIACHPKLLIVDEPTSALDPKHAVEVVKLLDNLRQSLGFAMILVSHQLSVIKALTDRVLTLYAGEVVEEGGTIDVLRSPRHPYTRGLIQSACDLNPYKDLWGIAGEPPQLGKSKGCAFESRCYQSTKVCQTKRPELSFITPYRKVACHKGGIEQLLRATGLVKKFDTRGGQLMAVDNVDLKLQKGEVAALVGPSGCGKSTLAHMLAGVLMPDHGEIYFCGRKLNGHAATSTMGGMQIVFQDPAEAVSHRFTVAEAVREPLDIMKWKTRRERDLKVVAALKSVYLPTTLDFLQRTCHGLSGGQRQRLAVARAMVTDPSLLIADEITSFLDPSTQATLVRELKELQNRRGFSMLFITHDLFLARKVAEQVYVMENGRFKAVGADFEMMDELAATIHLDGKIESIAVQ